MTGFGARRRILDGTAVEPKKVVVRAMISLAIVTSLFILVAVLAVAFGADSRDGDDWFTHTRI